MDPPQFFYDLGSPFAWLSAERIDDVMPVAPVWVPVLLGGIFKATGRSSWARTAERDGGMAEVEERAARAGLPPVVWPEGWPDNYLHAMRVAAAAGSREFALAAFRAQFTQGLSLADPANVEAAAAQAGVAPDLDKDGLRANTDRALALGVFGVPTIVVGGAVYWGDDRLEEAASALEQELE